MKLKEILQQSQFHFVVITTFFVVAFFYCKPAFDNKYIPSTDGVQYQAMIQGSKKVQEESKLYHVWNKNLFSGMPFIFDNQENLNWFALLVSSDLFHFLALLLFINVLNYTFVYFFSSCVSFYLLSQILRVNKIIGALGAFAYAYAVQTSILVIAGHHTKLMSMAFIPLVISGLILVTQKKYFIGILVGLIGVRYVLVYEHYQMFFYTIVALSFLSVAYLVKIILDKTKGLEIIKTLSALVIMVAIAIMFLFPKLMSFFEYSKETTRNGSKIVDKSSQLKPEVTKKEHGVGKDYAFSWSYTLTENLTFITPNIYGASSGGVLNKNAHSVKKLIELGYNEEDAFNTANSFSTYWGDQPFTFGPIYFGIIIVALAILCFIYFKNWLVWGLISFILFSIFIALGKNFSTFNFVLYDYLPFYNKFRAPTMIFTITQFAIVLLAILGLQKLFVEQNNIIHNKKFIKTLLIILGSALFLVLAFYLNASFVSPKDKEFVDYLIKATNNKDIANALYNALKEDRKDLLQSSIFSLIITSLAFLGLIYFYIKKKLTLKVLLFGITAIVFIDYIKINRSYINDTKFIDKEEDLGSSYFPKTPMDERILTDKDPNYRVFDLRSGNMFNDASASYYHRSIGGYYPAKLSLYQDLIDSQLTIVNSSVLNMLNAKYIIQKDNQEKEFLNINANTMGPCWFVKKVNFVPDTKTEMTSLNKFNPKNDAFVLEDFKPYFTSQIKYDSAAKITNTISTNDLMTYETQSASPQFAVFSEIYYLPEWKAFIDSKETPIIKTNYVLRGLIVPEGKHKIEFVCDVYTYKKYSYLINFASLVFIALVICMVIFEINPWYKKYKTLKQ